MRYRKLSAQGDYTLGTGDDFFVNSPDAVAQAVQTRMRLFTGEWFLNTAEGLDRDQIVGNRTQGTRDQEIKQRILGTQGVKSILQYQSQINPIPRSFSVSAVIDTIYGALTVTASSSGPDVEFSQVFVEGIPVFMQGTPVFVRL